MSNEEFIVRRDDINDDLLLHGRQIQGDKRLYAKPIEFAEHMPGGWVPPAARISYTAAQKLMDSLWDCGLRPSEGTGSAGALKATQEHLADLRKILGHSLGTTL